MRHRASFNKARWTLSGHVEPLNNRVIVKRCKNDESHGLVLVTEEKHHWGEVLAIGPGKKLKNGQRGEMAFKVGDRVLLGHYDDYPTLAADVIVVREGDILAVEDGA